MTKAANLVIVESPAKAKTIEKYLGSNYKVKASMGHLRDLPKSKLGVDIENGFTPEYIPVKDKGELIAELRKAAASAKTVYLATDPDREGEAISWHLKELLKIPDEKAKRVTFNEITKKVVTESISQPREIDMDLVDAQQARRVLDRIVGYQLSPLLWRKVKKNLSAGRVQSVAARMVVDREEEIRNFVSREYWNLDVRLRSEKDGSFTARYYGVGEKKTELGSRQDVDRIVEAVKDSPFTVEKVEKGRKERRPAPPFITSTLQQEASRKFSMAPKRTMSLAQQLYEGVELEGRGSVGLITYMRTDSLRLSEEAITAARKYIGETYGEAYCPEKPNRYKAKEGAQDAHEAIRPTDIYLTPEVVRKNLTLEQYKLYKLIWERFTACQMKNALFDSVSVDVRSAGYSFRASYSEQIFSGHLAVYKEAKDEETAELSSPIPNLTRGQNLWLEKTMTDQLFTQPPSRYTEATLIKAMEEKGIGRPSTYAPTISTITTHDYVIKEGKHLRPTNLGETVTNAVLKVYFPDIVDLKFTNEMESRLDDVESGKTGWRNIISEFYTEFSSEMTNAESQLEGKRIKVPEEFTEETCDICGKFLVKRKGRFGYFLACPGFPDCTFTKPIVEEMPGMCPQCGRRILKRKSGKGSVYFTCEEHGKSCEFWTWDVPTKDFCPSCGKTLFKPGGRGPLKSFCINPDCSAFVPEDKRHYPKKTAASANTDGVSAVRTASSGNNAVGESRQSLKEAKETSSSKETSKKKTDKKSS